VSTGSKPKQYINLNNARHEASRHFRNKMKEYLEAQIDELETNNKIINTRDM